MAHIFGIPHSVGEAFDEFLGIGPSIQPPAPFFDPVITPLPGPSIGNGNNGCPPTGKKKYYSVTVFPDGTSCTKERKSRKRRLRLATASDIADLSSLISILGKGEALKHWIATRRGR